MLSLFLLAAGDPSEGLCPHNEMCSFITGPPMVVATPLGAARAPWSCAGALCLGVPRVPKCPHLLSGPCSHQVSAFKARREEGDSQQQAWLCNFPLSAFSADV